MQPIQQFATSVLAEVIRRQPSSDSRTMLAWQVAVGSKLARTTSVRLADGVLTVGATDPRWVTEIEAARDIVLRRLQELLGPGTITRISVERKAREPGSTVKQQSQPAFPGSRSETRKISAHERKLFK